MKYPAAEVDIGVTSELYTAGVTEDGEGYVAEQYRVVARVKADGRTFKLSHYWKGCEVVEDGEGGASFADVREKAAAAAEIDANGFRALAVFDTEMRGSPANPEAAWYEVEPEYGSKHWQALDAAEGRAAHFDRAVALHRAGEPQDEYNPTFLTQAPVSIETLIKSCDAFLAAWAARAEAEREELIVDEMQPGIFSRGKTREQAIEALKGRVKDGIGSISEWDWPEFQSFQTSMQFDRVNAIRGLALASKRDGAQEMQLGVDDYSLVSNFWAVEEDAETLTPAM
jgi:hypothetical protein